MSVEGSSGSNSSTPEESVSRHVMERIKLMRQEFEELLLLKYVAEMLKDFRNRLIEERWD